MPFTVSDAHTHNKGLSRKEMYLKGVEANIKNAKVTR